MPPAGDRNLKIVAEEPYIARTQGTRTFPWRVAVVAEKDAALLENELVWLLAEPAADADWEWVKPGQVSWDWWNGMRLTGVDFRAGRNTESYRTTSTSPPDTVFPTSSWTRAGRLRRPTSSIPIPISICRS